MSDAPRDRIYIRDLTLECIIGIFDFERNKKQQVVLNVILHTDLAKAGHSDDISDTIDYKQLKKRIMAMVQHSSYFLIERLAEAVAQMCLADSRVQRVDVTVDKPGALRYARSVAVEITRERSAEP